MNMSENKVGRPTDYKPDYCAEVIEHGKAGKSYTQIACLLDINRDTLYEWRDTYPEFSDALKRSRQYAQAWWENVGQNQMIEPLQGFSASMFAKQVSCRFPEDYTDKSKQEITGGTSLEVRFVNS